MLLMAVYPYRVAFLGEEFLACVGRLNLEGGLRACGRVASDSVYKLVLREC